MCVIQFNLTFNIISVIVIVPTCSRYGDATLEGYIAGTFIKHHIRSHFTVNNGALVNQLGPYFLGLIFNAEHLARKH